MKKIFTLLLMAIMSFTLVACGETTKESTVVTVENWDNYLEVVVETNEDEGFLNYSVYFKAKEGVVISNETNTTIHFSYDLNKQHYTKENNKIVLGQNETIENNYTTSYPMYGNQKEEEFCTQIDNIQGSQWSFTDGDYWTIIPSNFAITEIEGTIFVQ